MILEFYHAPFPPLCRNSGLVSKRFLGLEGLGEVLGPCFGSWQSVPATRSCLIQAGASASTDLLGIVYATVFVQRFYPPTKKGYPYRHNVCSTYVMLAASADLTLFSGSMDTSRCSLQPFMIAPCSVCFNAFPHKLRKRNPTHTASAEPM